MRESLRKDLVICVVSSSGSGLSGGAAPRYGREKTALGASGGEAAAEAAETDREDVLNLKRNRIAMEIRKSMA